MVCWTREPTADAIEKKKKDVEVTAGIQPEKRHPGHNSNEYSTNASIDLHPFWHIHRSCIDGKPNCKLVDVQTHLVITADSSELSSWGTAVDEGKQQYSFTVPHIIHDKKIRTGQKIVLKWCKESEKEKPKVPTHVTAFDNLNIKPAKN